MPERLAHPLRVGADGRFVTVGQDSDDDVRQCIRLTLAHRPGDRPDLPQMGTIDPAFDEEIDGSAIREMLERHEPRASIHVDIAQDELDAFTRDVTVAYEHDEPESEG